MEACRVLIIDDDARVCRIGENICAKYGYEAVSLSESVGIESEISQFKPDKILLDLNMPDKDGVETLAHLSAIGCSSQVILMSGEDERILNSSFNLGCRMGLRMGVSVQKPFSQKKLIESLASKDPVEETLSEPRHRALAPKVDGKRLRQGIQLGEIVPYYQPIFDLASMEVVGLEALCRWHRPCGEIIPPAEILPLAECEGLMVDLTLELLDFSLEDLRCWDSMGMSPKLSINLSPCLLINEGLPEILISRVAAAGVEPSRICFEVTESSDYMGSLTAMNVLSRLRLKGFGLSMDDFGTGFASMEKLHLMPFTELKIDRSFISQMDSSSDAEAIVKSLISMSVEMGIPVVAEGVADQEMARKLRSFGCDLAQGFGLARPGDFESVLDVLAGNEFLR